MSPFNHSIPATTICLAIVLATCVAAHGEPRESKLDLTPQSFTELHTLIRPHADEWRHLKVNWMTDIIPARKKAAEEDKPMIILYTGGAGYNEPLGVC